MAHQGIPYAFLKDPTLRYMLLDFMRRLIPIIPDGVRPTSWYRSAEENAAVHGDRESQHLYALATDWTGSGPGLQRMRFLAPTRGLVAVPEDDHLHIQRYPHGLLALAGFPFPPRV